MTNNEKRIAKYKTIPDTIKAQNGGYICKPCRREDDPEGVYNYRRVYDGETVLFVGKLRSVADYLDEVVDGNNECARFNEIFTTAKGNRYIYWQDVETDEDYLTPLQGELL